jgi:hypothetical protein
MNATTLDLLLHLMKRNSLVDKGGRLQFDWMAIARELAENMTLPSEAYSRAELSASHYYAIQWLVKSRY